MKEVSPSKLKYWDRKKNVLASRRNCTPQNLVTGLRYCCLMLFYCHMVHGSVIDDLLLSTTVPIPKGRNVDLTDSENDHGITLCSVFGLYSIWLRQISDKLD